MDKRPTSCSAKCAQEFSSSWLSILVFVTLGFGNVTFNATSNDLRGMRSQIFATGTRTSVNRSTGNTPAHTKSAREAAKEGKTKPGASGECQSRPEVERLISLRFPRRRRYPRFLCSNQRVHRRGFAYVRISDETDDDAIASVLWEIELFVRVQRRIVSSDSC